MHFSVSILLLDEFEEQQPPELSEHICGPNLLIFCPLCAQVWGHVFRIGDNWQGEPVKQNWWSAFEARCEDCGDGSLLRFFTKDVGPKLTQREVRLLLANKEERNGIR